MGVAFASPVAGYGFVLFSLSSTLDQNDILRWTQNSQSYLESGERGLGGGIEYSISLDFCESIKSSFWISNPNPTCEEIESAIHKAFDAWEVGHPSLRFIDISDHVEVERSPIPKQTYISEPLGAEIDIIPFLPGELGFPAEVDHPTAFANPTRSMRAPLMQDSSYVRGMTITSVDILINTSTCFHLYENYRSNGCAHLQSTIMHEIGHAIGLHHPDQFASLNWAFHKPEVIQITRRCSSQNDLFLSNEIDEDSVMNAYSNIILEKAELSYDDLNGRNFLYPICEQKSNQGSLLLKFQNLIDRVFKQIDSLFMKVLLKL